LLLLATEVKVKELESIIAAPVSAPVAFFKEILNSFAFDAFTPDKV
jgi:hypothetical protein